MRVTQTLPEIPGPGGNGGWVRITDTWTATDLQALVLEHISIDGSETNTQMTKLRREEQPSSLFEVPPEYQIEDELQDFIIQYATRGRNSPAQVIRRVQPKYTQTAGSLGIQGKVLLSATVDESGKAREVRVERSVDPGLDQEAIKAVRQWRFRPAHENGPAVRMDVEVEVTFGLN